MQPLDASRRLDEAGQALAEEAVGRAKDIAARYARIFPEHADDFESSAMWGVIRAATSYEPDESRTWDHWSRLCAKGEVRDFLGGAYINRRTLWPRKTLESVVDWRDGYSDMEARDAVDRLLAMLTPRQRELCTLVYKDGLSPYSAGQSLGMTGEHGCKVHREALAFLRDALAA